MEVAECEALAISIIDLALPDITFLLHHVIVLRDQLEVTIANLESQRTNDGLLVNEIGEVAKLS